MTQPSPSSSTQHVTAKPHQSASRPRVLSNGDTSVHSVSVLLVARNTALMKDLHALSNVPGVTVEKQAGQPSPDPTQPGSQAGLGLAFSPDGSEVWVLADTTRLDRYELVEGQLLQQVRNHLGLQA
ncbi:hypothetical protein V8C86DRAFT_3118679 [Haematococcus lacustris]